MKSRHIPNCSGENNHSVNILHMENQKYIQILGLMSIKIRLLHLIKLLFPKLILSLKKKKKL